MDLVTNNMPPIKIPQTKLTRSKDLITIHSSKRGTNKLLQEARLRFDEVKEAINMIQVEDGLYKTKWGSAYYGEALSDNIDGASEYVKADGTTELIVVAGGKLYKSTNGGTWTEITGLGYTAGIKCIFQQIGGYLYISNGTDNLTRYNGSSILTYTSLSTPTNLAGTRQGGLSSGSYTIYAEVTALNDVGETVGSTEVSVNIDKERNSWSTADSDGITWTWDAVSGASRYQIYISDESGDEALLASTTTNSYTDNGTATINPYIITPLEDTTTAPKFRSMCVSGNRMWGTNIDTDKNRYTVFFSGTGNYMGVFSNFYGGGWVNLEKGGREIPQAIVHYQSGQGAGIATALCKTPDGKGAIWQIKIDSLSVGDTTFPVPTTSKIVGSFGTEAVGSVVQTTRNIMFANRTGIYSLGAKENYYGILVTQEESVNIRNYIDSLISSKVSGIESFFYDGKVFFSVPQSSSVDGNNRIIIWDTERKNWSVYWDNQVKQFLTYTTTSGNTKFLYVPTSGTKLIEINSSYIDDLGTAFTTSLTTGRYNIRKSWRDYAKIRRVYLRLANPRGTINFEVSGTKKGKAFRVLASKSINPVTGSTGMGIDGMGSVIMGSTNGSISGFTDSNAKYYLKVNAKVNDIQLKVSSNTANTEYTVQGFIIEGRDLNVRPPSTWKL